MRRGGLDLKATKKGRRKLKQVAKDRNKLSLTVISLFEPASGKPVVRSKRVTIRVD